MQIILPIFSRSEWSCVMYENGVLFPTKLYINTIANCILIQLALGGQ